MSVQRETGRRETLFAGAESIQEVCDMFSDPPEFRRFKATARQEYEAWKSTQPNRVVDPSAPRPRFTVELHV